MPGTVMAESEPITTPPQTEMRIVKTKTVNDSKNPGIEMISGAGVVTKIAEPKKEEPPETKNKNTGSFPSMNAVAIPNTELKKYAYDLMETYGWSKNDFGIIDWIFEHESGWNPNSINPTSGARGIPQCLKQGTVDKCSAPPFQDYDTNPKTQIKWGLDYIKQRYGTPKAAKDFWLAHNWY